MDTQEREKNIYDLFEQKALNGGITTADFRKYLVENPKVNADDREHIIITQPDYRFRKIVGEFSDLLTKSPDGRMVRYFLEKDSYRESLYHRHRFQSIHIQLFRQKSFQYHLSKIQFY